MGSVIVSDGDSVLDFFKGMGILLIIFIILAVIVGTVAPEDQVNITETVVNKETVHLHKFMENSPDYYIYTDSYCFNVNLHDYNSLSVGDNVTVSVKEGTTLATLYLDDGGEYFNV